MAAIRATMPLFVHHLNKVHLLTPMQLAAFTPRQSGFHTFNKYQKKRSRDSLDKIASKLIIGKDPSKPLLYIKSGNMTEIGNRRSMSSKSKSKCKKKKSRSKSRSRSKSKCKKKKSRSKSRSRSKSKCKKKKSRSKSRSRSKSKCKKKKSRSKSRSKSKGKSCTFIMKPKAKKTCEKKITVEECCCYCDKRVREALDTLAAIVKCKAREIAEGSDDPFITGKKKKSRSKSRCKKRKKSRSRSKCKKKSKSKSRSKSKCKKKKSKSKCKKKKSKSKCSLKKKKSSSKCKKAKSTPNLCKKKSKKKIAGNLAKKCKSDSALSKKESCKSICKKKKKDKCKKKGKKHKKKGAPKVVCKKRYTKHLCKKRPSKKSKKGACKKKSKKDVCKKKKSKKDVCKKKKSKKDVCKKKKSKKDVCKKKKSSKSVCSAKSSKKLKKKKSSKSLCKKKSSKKKSSTSLCRKKSSKKLKKKSSKCTKKKKSSKDLCKKKSSKKLKKKSSKCLKKKKSSKDTCKKKSSKNVCKKKSSKKVCKKKSSKDTCKKKSSKKVCKKKSSKDTCKKKSSKKVCKKKSSKDTCKKKSSKDMCKKKSSKDICKKKSSKDTCKKKSSKDICKKKKSSKSLCKKKSKAKKKKSKDSCNKSSSSIGQNEYCVFKTSKSSKSLKKIQSAPCNAKLTKCPSCKEIKAVCEAQHKKGARKKIKDPLAKCKKLAKKKSGKSKKKDEMTCYTPKQKLPDCLKDKKKSKPKKCKRKKKKKDKKGSNKCKRPKKKCSSSILGSHRIVCPGQDNVGVKFLSTESVRADLERSPSMSSVKYDSKLGKFAAFESVKKTQSEDKSLSRMPSFNQDKYDRKSINSIKYDNNTGRFVEFGSVKKTQSEDKNLSRVPSFSQDKHDRKSTSSVKYDSNTGRFVAFKTVKKTQSGDKSLSRVPSFSHDKHDQKSTSSVRYDRDAERFVAFDSVKKISTEGDSFTRAPSYTKNKYAEESVKTLGENIKVQPQDTKENKDMVKTEGMSIDKIVTKQAQGDSEPISDNVSYSDEVSVSQMMHQYSMNKGGEEALPDSTTSKTLIQPRQIKETGSLNYENEVLIASNDKVHKTLLSVPPDAEKIVLEIDLKNIQDGPVITKITATPNYKVEVEQRRTQEAETNETEDIRKLNMPKDIAVKQPPKALSEVKLYTLQSPYRKQMVPQHLHKELKNYLKATGLDKPNTLVFQAKQVKLKKTKSKKLAAKDAEFDIKRNMHTGERSVKDPLVNPLVRDMREPSFDTYSCREPMSMKLEIVDPCLSKACVVDPQTEWYGPVVCYGRDLTNKTFADIYPPAQKKKKKMKCEVFDPRRCGPQQDKPNFGVCKYYHPMEAPTCGACTEARTLDDIICPKKRDTFYGRLFKLPVAIDECEVVITYQPKPEQSIWMVMKRKAMLRLAQRLRKEAEIRECCEEKRKSEEICQMKPPSPVDYCTLNFDELVQCNNIKRKSRQMQEECFKRITARWNRMILLRKRRQRKRLNHSPRYTDLPKRGTCATFMDTSQTVTMSPPGHELKPDYKYKGAGIATGQTVRPEWRSNVASTMEVVAAQNNPNLQVYRDGTARQLCSNYNKCVRKFKIIEAGHPGPSRCNSKQICTCQEDKNNKDKDNKDDKEKQKKKKKPPFIGSSIVPVMINSNMFDELTERGFFCLPEYNPKFTSTLLTSIVCQLLEDTEKHIMSATDTMLLPMYLMIEYILARVLSTLAQREASTVQLVREGSLRKKISDDDEHAHQSPDKKKSDALQKKTSRENVVRAIASYFARLFPTTSNPQEQKPVSEVLNKTKQPVSGVVVPKSIKDQTEQVTKNLRAVLKRRREKLKILLTKKHHDTSKAFHEAEKKLKRSEDLLREVTNNIDALEEKIKGLTDMSSAKQRALKAKLNSYHSQMAETQQILEQHIAVQKRRLKTLKTAFSEVKGDAWKSLQKMSKTTEKIDKLRKAGMEESSKVLPKAMTGLSDMWLTGIKQMKETIKSLDKPENWSKLHQHVEEIRKMVHNKVTDPTIENALKALEGQISKVATKHRSAQLKTKVKELKDQLAKLKALADKSAKQGKTPALQDLKAAAEEKKREIKKLLKEVAQQDEKDKGKGKK